MTQERSDADIGWAAWQHAVNAVGSHDATNAYAELVQYIREAVRDGIEREYDRRRFAEEAEALRTYRYLERCRNGGPWNLPDERDIMPIFNVTLDGAEIYLTIPDLRKMLAVMRPGEAFKQVSTTTIDSTRCGLVNDVVILRDMHGLHSGTLTDEAEAALRQVMAG